MTQDSLNHPKVVTPVPDHLVSTLRVLLFATSVDGVHVVGVRTGGRASQTHSILSPVSRKSHWTLRSLTVSLPLWSSMSFFTFPMGSLIFRHLKVHTLGVPDDSPGQYTGNFIYQNLHKESLVQLSERDQETDV